MSPIALLALLTLAAQGQTSPPKSAGSDVPAPAVVHRVDPVYPAEALQQNVSGIVIVELIIDEQGQVASAELLRGVPQLDAAALTAVRQWRFAVTLVDGRPVRVRHVVPLSFSQRLPAKSELPPAAPAGAEAPRAERSTSTEATSAPPVEVIRVPAEASVPPLPPATAEGASAVPDVTLGSGIPDLLSGRRPVMPPLARIHKVSGTVTVRFSVDGAGRTTVDALDGPEILKPQAEHAVRSWSFRRTSTERLWLKAVFTYAGDTASASVASE